MAQDGIPPGAVFQTDPNLLALQQQLRAPIDTGFWGSPAVHRNRLEKELAHRQNLIDAYMLPLQVQAAEARAAGLQVETAARQFDLKARKQELGYLAGKGMVPGVGAVDLSQMQENLMRAKAANQQAKSVAFELEQAQRPYKDILKEKFDAFASIFAPGFDGEEVMQAQGVQAAMQNSMDAIQGRRVADFTQRFDEIEQQFGKIAGGPVNLFSNKSAMLAAKQVDDLINGQGLSEDDAFAQVMSAATNGAQQQFRSLTASAGAGPQIPTMPEAPTSIGGIDAFLQQKATVEQFQGAQRMAAERATALAGFRERVAKIAASGNRDRIKQMQDTLTDLGITDALLADPRIDADTLDQWADFMSHPGYGRPGPRGR